METEWATLFVGLTELPLGEAKLDFGHGVVLQPASATFMSPLTLVNTSEESMKTMPAGLDADGYPRLPRPAYWQIGNTRTLITAELQIPTAAAETHKKRFEIARFLVLMLRLWSNPAVTMHALADHSFSTLTELDEGNRARIIPLETSPRALNLRLADESTIYSSLEWVQKNWRAALDLYTNSTEFRLAADALDSGQFVANEALVLVSLWGALEALFSPSTSELKFRVSALIASYMEPPGVERAALQKRVASLYDKRSGAAHGKPRHRADDVLASFELLRRVIIRMIHEQAVPSKEALELKLFGA